METKIKVLLVSLSLYFTSFSFGQFPYENPKYGIDSASRVECVKNLSLYREFIKQNDLKYAEKPWKLTFSNCPQATKNIYLDGVKIIRYLIDNETNNERKETLIDSLMLVYDQRVLYFQEEGIVLGRKASDLLKYRPEAIDEAHEYLKKSVTIEKNESDAVVLLLLMQTTKAKYLKGELSKEIVLENYTRAIDILDSQLITNPDEIDKIKIGKENIEKSFFSMDGVASCDAIANFYEPKFNESPNNVGLLKTIITILDKFNCKNSTLYLSAAENLCNIEPSANSAYTVGKIYKNNGNYVMAAEYYKQAIKLEQNNVDKSKLYIELGDLTYRYLGNYPLARSYANEAIKYDNTSGHPYILIGNIYATAKDCGDDEFVKKALFWLATDQYAKAKKIDPELAEDANKYIALYSQYFPDNEIIFFHGLKVGETYTVECWINETTTIRAR